MTDNTFLPPDKQKQCKLPPNLTRREINQYETLNIAAAIEWLQNHRFRKSPLNEKFLFALHKQMLGNVWKWAGKIRDHDVNIGNTHYFQVLVELHQLFMDVEAMVKAEKLTIPEIAIILYHRLTLIHPFSDGNGRCSRIFVNAFLKYHKQTLFSWGRNYYDDIEAVGSKARQEHKKALQLADTAYDYSLLLAFARA